MYGYVCATIIGLRAKLLPRAERQRLPYPVLRQERCLFQLRVQPLRVRMVVAHWVLSDITRILIIAQHNSAVAYIKPYLKHVLIFLSSCRIAIAMSSQVWFRTQRIPRGPCRLLLLPQPGHEHERRRPQRQWGPRGRVVCRRVALQRPTRAVYVVSALAWGAPAVRGTSGMAEPLLARATQGGRAHASPTKHSGHAYVYGGCQWDSKVPQSHVLVGRHHVQDPKRLFGNDLVHGLDIWSAHGRA